jgi:ribosome-associated protein
MEKSTQELCEQIVQILDEKKAEHIKVIDVSKKSVIADFFIIASAQSSRQLYALAEHISIFLKQSKIIPVIDGTPPSDWVVVDGGDVIIHLFRKEARDYYNLEKMWNSHVPNE